jgi:hypothetical protein
MSEEKKPFTVSDRRHFTSEGEVRNTDADEAAPGPDPGEEASRVAPTSPAESAPASSSEAAASSSPETTAPPLEAHPPDEAERGPRYPTDLLGLLISLGAQASTLLMGAPEGETPDLEGAHALIELLGSLKEKTEGHRTPQEDQLIDGLLYELRMAYVQVSKAGGR